MPATHDRVMRAVNRFPALLLRSPLHGVLSDGVLLISFSGRTSGKRYTTPINYLRDGNTLLLTTDSPWWRNLRGAPVTLRLRGREVAARAEVVTDEAAVIAALEAMMRRFPRYGRLAGVRRDPDGRPNRDDLVTSVRQGRVLIRARRAGEIAPAPRTRLERGGTLWD